MMGVQNLAWHNLGQRLVQMAESMLTLVYPPQCFVCLQCEQSLSCRFLCEGCLARVLEADLPPLRSWKNSEELHPEIQDCESDLAAWYYEDSMMALIPRMKYQNRPAIAKVFAEIAAARLQAPMNTVLLSAEKGGFILVPVPLHPLRQRERGYNQSLLIARAFSKKWQLAMLPRALRRTRFTQSQAKLNATERAKNVNGVFVPGDAERIAGRTVLLVDDVITTGATVSACARALQQTGAARVIALALARAGRGLKLKR